MKITSSKKIAVYINGDVLVEVEVNGESKGQYKVDLNGVFTPKCNFPKSVLDIIRTNACNYRAGDA
jgi:hypothetical protein